MDKAISAQNFYALFCDCGEKQHRYMLCGVYASKKEAQEVNKEIAGCVVKHLIKKCKVRVVVKQERRAS